jgi:hypothetical protein
MWRGEFEALRREGGCFVLTNHLFLSGRPARAVALEGLIEHVAGCADVWLAPLSDIARHVRGLALKARAIPKSELRGSRSENLSDSLSLFPLQRLQYRKHVDEQVGRGVDLPIMDGAAPGARPLPVGQHQSPMHL